MSRAADLARCSPLLVGCDHCGAKPGQLCMTESPCRCQSCGVGYARRPHAARVRLALAVAAHADPALDGFPELGPTSPCGVCGVPGLPQRHRVVNAIAGMLAGGEDPEALATDYGVTVGAVRVVGEWAVRWPGVWK